MRTSAWTVFMMGLLISSPLSAQKSGSRFVGTWLGTLETSGSQIHLSLSVFSDSSGYLSGEMVIVGRFGRPLMASVGVHGDSLMVTMPTANAYYFAVPNTQTDTLRGTFMQNGALPLVMTREAAVVKARPQGLR
jgi:hypothetical protein